MDVARDLPVSEDIVTVVAQTQTRGRGRFDRVWISPPQGGLYLTVRMPWRNRPLVQAPLVSLGCALALGRLCRELGIEGTTLKWPNDLLLSGKKAAGILAEMIHPQGTTTLLVGVGIDVSLPESSLLAVGQPTTTLSVAAGIPLECEPILHRFLAIWSEVDKILEAKGFPALVDEFRTFSDAQGRTFRLAGTGPIQRIRVRCILEDGALEVELLSTGEIRQLHGGELLADAP
ncbi:MAG: biotin--[acetyl-CoA-carboxylase] ligase [Fibrobacterota bacterium]|nr:biotin--[acetyl-CoA-carboxylase] ligase [Fibrobacterota bacterium]QQS04773.1 MAG: biotin--[acetyl-CoA-carboxylase] ligase [Fibrobacterota bacterium]